MKLTKFDNQLVRLEDFEGNVFEGFCTHNSRDYNFHEFGQNEEGVQISVCLFYESGIKKIEIIDSFSSSYGTLEEMILDDDIILVEEVFESEDDITISRLLSCIEDHLKSEDYKFDKNELKEVLEGLLKFNDNKIQEQAKRVIDLL